MVHLIVLICFNLREGGITPHRRARTANTPTNRLNAGRREPSITTGRRRGRADRTV